MQTLGILILALTIFVIAAGVFLWRALTTPYQGYPRDGVRVEIRRGWNSRVILQTLENAGVLRDEFVPLLYLKTVRRGSLLKAGVYEFTGANSPLEVIDKLARGDVVLITVTIREGLDRFAIAELMSAADLGTVDVWNETTADPSLIRDLAPEADSLEGYLFPDTYKVAPGTSPASIAAIMVANFRKNFGDELAYISTGLDLHQTVTLASIVETEARIADERPVIAGVYRNRLERGMLLQADPTVIYALKLDGSWDGNIRRPDLQIESPYNTYRFPGLPPHPIANPGVSSLMAAAHPADTQYFYFVSRNDGSHAFANNLQEHNRNVAEFQKRYWRRQRLEAGRSDDAAAPPNN